MLNFFLCVYHTITHIILKKYYWSLSQCPNLNSFRINVLVLSSILVRSFSMKINSCWIKISFVLILKVSKYWPMQLLIHVVQCSGHVTLLRRVWRYQRGNQNPYIEEQTTQWRKEKVQKDKQRCTKHTYRTKDWGELWCSRRVCRSCSTSGTRRVNLVTNPIISCE